MKLFYYNTSHNFATLTFRPNSSQAGSSKSTTQESHCVLPQQLLIRLQSDGDLIIIDKVLLDSIYSIVLITNVLVYSLVP